MLFLFNKTTELVTITTDWFKALICFVNKLIYKSMGDNGFGDMGVYMKRVLLYVWTIIIIVS